jgi:hypothetical protein
MQASGFAARTCEHSDPKNAVFSLMRRCAFGGRRD